MSTARPSGAPRRPRRRSPAKDWTPSIFTPVSRRSESARSSAASTPATSTWWSPPTPSAWESTSRTCAQSCTPRFRARLRATSRRPAGRDGDGAHAHCLLLFDPDDTEQQFSLTARARLERRDIQAVLRAIRRLDERRRRHHADTEDAVVATAGEILLQDRRRRILARQSHGRRPGAHRHRVARGIEARATRREPHECVSLLPACPERGGCSRTHCARGQPAQHSKRCPGADAARRPSPDARRPGHRCDHRRPDERMRLLAAAASQGVQHA